MRIALVSDREIGELRRVSKSLPQHVTRCETHPFVAGFATNSLIARTLVAKLRSKKKLEVCTGIVTHAIVALKRCVIAEAAASEIVRRVNRGPYPQARD
jgi:hypothetical protein